MSFFFVAFVAIVALLAQIISTVSVITECQEGQMSYWDYHLLDLSSKPFLCQCPPQGQTTPICYGSITYETYPWNLEMESLIRGACAWSFEVHNCSASDWVMVHGGCPNCRCSIESSWSSDACMKSQSCHYDSLEFEYPEHAMFTGDLTFPVNAHRTDIKAGCEDDVICTMIGNGKCASSTISNISVWRYNCTSNELYRKSYNGTNKYKCCNSSDSIACGISADLSFCPENSLLSSAWSNAFPCLFGDHMRSAIQKLGENACSARQEGAVNIWDSIFQDNSCSDPALMGFMANMGSCYCKYLATFWASLDSVQKREVRIHYRNWVRRFMQMMTEGGCTFRPVCNFAEATMTGNIASRKIRFTLTVNTTISNHHRFCRGVGAALGVRSSKQITCTVDRRSRQRRLSSVGEIMQVEANAVTVAEEADIKGNLAKLALASGVRVIVSAATAVIESTSLADAVANSYAINITATTTTVGYYTTSILADKSNAVAATLNTMDYYYYALLLLLLVAIMQ